MFSDGFMFFYFLIKLCPTMISKKKYVIFRCIWYVYRNKTHKGWKQNSISKYTFHKRIYQKDWYDIIKCIYLYNTQ